MFGNRRDEVGAGLGPGQGRARPATAQPGRPPAGPRGTGRSAQVEIPQYPLLAILAVWAAAALPMAALAWLVAPLLADQLAGRGTVPLFKALLLTMTAGLVWQFVLVLLLVFREQRSLAWPVLRDALWLRAPRSPRTGRTGGRVWWVVLPFAVLFAAANLMPGLTGPGTRDLGKFLDSDAGHTFLSGSWTWFGLMVVLWVFNTVLGEELLFRGLLLPRMNAAFGRWDWVANGVLFAAYHLHVPWGIPAALLDMFTLAYPTKRYHSAWIGIAVHSTQSVFFGVLVLGLVLG